jgi:hypothetical protein
MKPTRPPGRPRLDAADDSVPVSTRMPTRQYDDLWQRAQAARITVAEQLRRDVAAAGKRIQK